MIKLFLFFSAVCLFVTKGLTAQIKPTDLTCEYLQNPSVVDVGKPRLAWINVASEGARGQKQTAWQIRVASAPEKLDSADLWNSGKVYGANSLRVPYGGKNLKSRMECWWQVRVWDVEGSVSDWSEPGFWRMGILDSSEWKAQWIGAPWQGEEPLPKPADPNALLPEKLPPPAPFFRKEVNIYKKVTKALAFVTGLGYFEFYINGEKVGDDVLIPNQTNYSKRPELPFENIPLDDNFREYRVMYLAYDVTSALKCGKNVFGSILGNGFYNPSKYWAGGYGTPRFLAQIHITYDDGTEDIIVSDESWKVSKGPILMDMVFYGEHYDSRKELSGWSASGFNDKSWVPAAIRKAPYGKLVAHTAYTDKVMERLQPLSIQLLPNGNYYVDFGQEISGWLRLNNVKAKSGHKINIKYICNTYSGDNSFVFKSRKPHSYAARFNWFVFSAVEISGWPGKLKPEQVTAEAVYTFVEETAHFETSNELFNKINRIWKRSQTDNMHGGLVSDCPHRERSGYTGDGQVACVTVMHNYDARNLYHKWIRDILGAQDVTTGYVPNGAPWQPGCGGGVAWGAAICIMPWEFYVHYGSKDILQDNYDAMKEYIRYMQKWVNDEGIMHQQRTGKDGNVLRWFNLGDWVAPGNLPPDDLVHTFYYWLCADLTSKTARVLGKIDEAEIYSEMADRTRAAFQIKFFDDINGTYGKAGGNIFALKMGVPDSQLTRVCNALRNDIIDNNGHLDTGIFGTLYFFETLSDYGMHDLAFQAMNKKDEPGYGRWIELGSTTTRERWDEEGSHNHPMFGGGLIWFYRKLAGMMTDPDRPGYEHIIFKPQPLPELSFVSYKNKTSYGEAGISWNYSPHSFSMEIVVPVGSVATVYVPIMKNGNVYEGNVPAKNAIGVHLTSINHEFQVFSIGSGHYYFKSN